MNNITVEEENKILKEALNLICYDFMQTTESCPAECDEENKNTDMYDFEYGCVNHDSECNDNQKVECWVKYYIDKVGQTGYGNIISLMQLLEDTNIW